MWRLKIAEGQGPQLMTVNNHIGRQHWEFDPDAGIPEERAEVERVREEFKKNRFQVKQSADLFMRMQLRKENPCGPIPAAVKVKEREDITEEAVTTTLRRAISFYSTIQAHDGHWPAESAGATFYIPLTTQKESGNYRGSQHHVWFGTELYCVEVARGRTRRQ